MSDEEPTVAVPVSLIEDTANLLDHYADSRASTLRNLLPKPTPRRLRVVDLDGIGSFGDGQTISWAAYRFLESAPDVMAIVEQAVRDWLSMPNFELSDESELISTIRAEIEEAVGRSSTSTSG